MTPGYAWIPPIAFLALLWPHSVAPDDAIISYIQQSTIDIDAERSESGAPLPLNRGTIDCQVVESTVDIVKLACPSELFYALLRVYMAYGEPDKPVGYRNRTHVKLSFRQNHKGFYADIEQSGKHSTWRVLKAMAIMQEKKQ